MPDSPRFFRSAAEFRAWLGTHHASDAALLVGLHRTSAGRGLQYHAALDEALAHGWIDGVRRSIDAERWCIRFTPRKPRSIWSRANILRARELIALGRMQPAGLRAFERRKPGRSGVYAYERAPVPLDAAARRQIRAHPRARAFFEAQPPGYRKLIAKWVMSARREDTRARRLARLIAVSARGQRIDFMKPGQ